MKIKLFGKEIFDFQGSRGDAFAVPVSNFVRDSKYLPDFYRRQAEQGAWSTLDSIVSNQVNTLTTGDGQIAGVSTSQALGAKGKGKNAVKREVKKHTPKGIYDLKMLNDRKFKLNVDPKYVDEQVATFKEKLALIKSEEFDMRNGVEEVASILVRMENRKKYPTFRTFYEQFAYTSTKHMEGLVKAHDYLKVGQVAQFVADMPKEAVTVMKGYDAHTMELCGKKAVFYIIADKKDFQKTNSRRDPILLAQSPFGHVWQILGAWDKEMLFLDEL